RARPRRGRRLPHPGADHPTHPRRPGAGPGLRRRDPGPARCPSRRARGGHRSLRARPRRRGLQRGAERDRGRAAAGFAARAGAGERFDLIASNPPFVTTPRGAAEGTTTWTYRAGGRAGDTLLAELLRALPSHLAPGGSAVLLGN